MIYIFLDDITEFKQYVGGAVNASMEMASLAPSVKDAFYTHVERWVGDAFWKRMIEGVAADNLTVNEALFLPYLRETVAYLSLYHYSSTGAVQFTESGLQREEGENLKTAYKYQVNEYRQYYLIQGYEALERMVLFLVENALQYPLWQDTEAEQEATALFINDTRTFRRRYNFNISRYTFEHLRGLMKDLDVFVAEACYGSALVADLKEKMRDGTLTPIELELVQWTQRAIAEFAIIEAMRRNLVQIQGSRVVIIEALEPQSYQREGLPNNNQFSITIQHHKEWAERLWHRAKRHLTDNQDDFPIYTAYLEALVVAEACPERESETDRRRPNYDFPIGGSKIVVL